MILPLGLCLRFKKKQIGKGEEAAQASISSSFCLYLFVSLSVCLCLSREWRKGKVIRFKSIPFHPLFNERGDYSDLAQKEAGAYRRIH